jgi:hypothetical protein
MDQVGDTMFAGGNFDTVAHATRKVTYPRRHLFSFSASTGAVSDVAPTVDGQVWAIAHSGNAVYIGGSFRTVDGVSRPVIAKFDATTGALDEAFKPPISVGRVNDLHLSNGRLIVAGSFGAKLLALNPTTGENTRFIASAITGVLPDSTGGSHVWRTAVAPTAVV